MVAEGYRLCDLQVSEARHHSIGIDFCLINESCSQARELAADIGDSCTQVKTNIGGNLIVTRSTRVKTFARITNDLC